MKHLQTSTVRKSRAVAGTSLAVAVLLTGCSVGGSSDSKSSSSSSSSAGGKAGANKTVTLVTHESWVMDKKLEQEFTKQTGYTLKVKKSGDAGELANKLVLSKGNPTGDVVFGIDNTFASRVASAGALEDYTSPKAPKSAAQYALPEGQGKAQLNPLDYGNVCVNVDDAWFKKNGKAKPTSLDDLTKPEYKDLMVAPGAASSSPGMAFLLATIGKYGQDGWKPYWTKLMSNGLKLTSGWSDAWGVEYTAGEGKGKRPIVVSYDSSPAATLDKSGKTTTSILTNSCFRSVEYAGVLKGAKNPEGAKALIDFLYSKSFQSSLPSSMYVFPVDSSVALPKEWADNVQKVEKPYNVNPKTINEKRSEWLTQWQDVTSK